jgi:hypothetical protein
MQLLRREADALVVAENVECIARVLCGLCSVV